MRDKSISAIKTDDEIPEIDFIIINLSNIKDIEEKKKLINERLYNYWYIVDDYLIGEDHGALLFVMEHLVKNVKD